VYRARVALIIVISFADCQLRDTFGGGKISVLFNGTVPITGATGTYGVPVLSYYYSLGFFGRSANLTASLPYAVGTFQGELIGEHQQIYRSGLVDSTFRFSVNLKGGPAMPMQEFAKWKQKTLLGVSLKVVAPTGQYSPTKLINWGSTVGPSNRNLAIPNAGVIMCSTPTQEYGSTPQIQDTFQSPDLSPKRYSRSAPSKAT
jgi:hypothetical protein